MGALVVFDLTNRKSFECVREWLEELEEKAPQNIVKVLVGNKADLSAEGKRAVPKEEAEKLAKEYEISYIETSARTGKHVRKAFIELTRQVVECVRELEMQCTYTPTPSPCHMDANRKKRRGDHDQEEKEEKALREGDKDLKDGVYTTSINHALSNGDLDVIQLADTSPVENRHGAYSLFSQAISFLPSSLQHLLLQKRRRRVVSTNRNIYHLFHFNEHPHSNALPFSLDQQESQEGRRRRKSQEDEEEREEKDDEETTRWKGEEREEEKEGERERRRKTEVERIRDYPYISRGMQFRRYAIDDQLDRCLDV
ncbi:ras-related protein rab2bv [Cystoisospora suis]|uniref:Ras-related protein rab2bv n=1 Tax=Cystoisospora suis TaxID=483139 RepID=A0A2C6LFH2_9APIC|nr:ras-related protein rab2bv [Cystoisospora suis]